MISTLANKFLKFSSIYDFFELIIGGKEGYRYFIEEVVSPHDNEFLLDVGCGTANLFPFLKNTNYYGFDIDDNYINHAKVKYSEGNFFCCDSDGFLEQSKDLPMFDKILSYGVLHHLSDEEVKKLITLIKKKLKPGGTFFSCDPCVCDDQSKIARWVVTHDRGQFVRRENEYRKLLEDDFELTSNISHDLIRLPTTVVMMKGTLL